ncbi:MAG: family efflux transporter [Sedimentibacter sp.]|jgi:putative MATE family efflux protein|nr:family efflux transporter [Sedimentibacter sp.]
MKQMHVDNNGIIEGIIWKQLLIFFFPMLFGTFFQQMYNTADAIIVGRYVGKEALSAVGGPTGAIINMFVNFFVGLSTGATVIISQYYGGKNEEDVSKSVHTSIALAIIGGIVITIAGVVSAPVVLKLMGTPDEIMSESLIYLKIYFIGMIPIFLYNMGAGILRAVGDSKRPLYYLIASSFINIALVLLFVVVFNLGVGGAAVGTVIAHVSSAIFVYLSLKKTNQCYRLNRKLIRLDMEIFNKIMQIGLPAGFQSLMYSISNIIIQANINSFGTDTVAAWTAYSKIDGIYWLIMASFGVSITTFVGQNYGAKKYDRVKNGIKICLFMTLSLSALMSLILYFGSNSFYSFFTDDMNVIIIGVEMVHIMVPAYFTYVFIEIYSGALRGMGNALMPMVLTGIGVCAFRILWIFKMLPVWHNMKTVVMSYPLSWIVTAAFFIIYFKYYTRKNKLCDNIQIFAE